MVQRMEDRWELPSCFQACGPGWLCQICWLSAPAGCPHPDSPGASPDRIDAVVHVA